MPTQSLTDGKKSITKSLVSESTSDHGADQNLDNLVNNIPQIVKDFKKMIKTYKLARFEESPMRSLAVLLLCGTIINITGCGSKNTDKPAEATKVAQDDKPQSPINTQSENALTVSEQNGYLKLIQSLYIPTLPQFEKGSINLDKAASYFVESRCEKQIKATMSEDSPLIRLPYDFEKICAKDNLTFVPGEYIQATFDQVWSRWTLEVVFSSEGSVIGYNRKKDSYDEQEFKMIKDNKFLVDYTSDQDSMLTEVKELNGLYSFSSKAEFARRLSRTTRVTKRLVYNFDANTSLNATEYIEILEPQLEFERPTETSVSCEMTVRRDNQTYQSRMQAHCFPKNNLLIAF